MLYCSFVVDSPRREKTQKIKKALRGINKDTHIPKLAFTIQNFFRFSFLDMIFHRYHRPFSMNAFMNYYESRQPNQWNHRSSVHIVIQCRTLQFERKKKNNELKVRWHLCAKIQTYLKYIHQF